MYHQLKSLTVSELTVECRQKCWCSWGGQNSNWME